MVFKKIFCRTAQQIIRLAMKTVPFREPQRVEGIDSFHSIPDILEQAKVWAPMIVTGPHMGKSDFVKTLYGELTERTVLYDKVHADPTISQIEEMAAIYRENRCDGIIAIGGGSNIDAAKAMAAMIARPDVPLRSMKGVYKVRHKTPLLIAVPTTAGTGSEVTLAAVVTDEKYGYKFAINDAALIPDYAVMDASLTATLPKNITATSGMDALTHAIEAYLNLTYHTQDTMRYCEEAVVGIMEFLPTAYEQGDALEAREEMLIASYKAGYAFTRVCVGNVHAIAHTIGGMYHVPHGLANAVVLPIVLEDYGAVVHDKLARLAELTQIDTEGTKAEKAAHFIEHIRQMNASLGIPDKITKIDKEDVQRMAVWADKEANPLYPVPVIYDRKRFEKIILRAAGK